MKNTTMIIVTALIFACNASAPGEYLGDGDDCTTELTIEKEIADDTQAELDECYLAIGEGEKVNLVADEPVEQGPFENVSNEDRQIASLLAEIERMAANHSEEIKLKDEQYNGLLEEKRKDDEKCAVMTSQCLEFRGLVGGIPECDLNANGIWQTVEGAE